MAYSVTARATSARSQGRVALIRFDVYKMFTKGGGLYRFGVLGAGVGFESSMSNIKNGHVVLVAY